VSSNLFNQNMTLQGDLISDFASVMVLKDYEQRNRTYFESLKDQEGHPVLINSQDDYERVICSQLN